MEGSRSKKMLLQAPMKPRFFKVVPSSFEQCLKIPDYFMRKYRRNLKDSHVILTIETGDKWKVELSHYGDGSRLEKGWKNFVDYYSIKHLFFLVFTYEGNSQFHVTIFDPANVEIEYPFEHREIFVQNLQSFPTNRASKRARNDQPKLRPRSRTSYEVDSDRDENTRSNRNQQSDCSKLKMKKRENRRKTLQVPNSISNHASVMEKLESTKAYKNANEFSLRSPHPNFIYIIQPSAVSLRFAVYLPAKFEVDYITKMKGSKVTLHIPGSSMEWPAILLNSTDRSLIGRGWKKFAEDNRLKVGDIYVFELVKEANKFYITNIS